MKKFLGFLLKLAAALMVMSAVVFAVVAYWDKITEFFAWVRTKVMEKKACCCHSSEFDDYADWEE